jgi:hypothetical protein
MFCIIVAISLLWIYYYYYYYLLRGYKINFTFLLVRTQVPVDSVSVNVEFSLLAVYHCLTLYAMERFSYVSSFICFLAPLCDIYHAN